ncbi:MAG: asparaginase [Gaiella sp.]|nr:asparaginase [Gaiella sp.]
MEPIVVEATRGEVVEARHLVHAVAVRDGRVELALGDPGLVAFLRSSAKPIQALPVVRARPDLDDEQIALVCASHLASPEQLAVVRRLLADAPATEDDLECGPDPTPIEHNCSGKHAGFLALCVGKGWPTAGYRLASHPCQAAMLEAVVEAAEARPVAAAVDGCGVQTFALPLERAAHAFARLGSLEGGERVVRAMRAHPELLRGPVATDAVLIRELDGWVAKGGAEGCFCAASGDGLGLALKVRDGAFRAIQPALALVLGLLGYAPGTLPDTAVSNSRGEQVGVLRVGPRG